MNNCWPVGVNEGLGKVDGVTTTAETSVLKHQMVCPQLDRMTFTTAVRAH